MPPAAGASPTKPEGERNQERNGLPSQAKLATSPDAAMAAALEVPRNKGGREDAQNTQGNDGCQRQSPSALDGRQGAPRAPAHLLRRKKHNRA